ncbi:MAG TPA: hypothetical protein VIH90_08465 [Candidatus Saccharimonadales bacterium]
MSIEYITPDLVLINGHYVEIRESREPDHFDLLSEAANRELKAQYAGPIHDIEIDFRYAFSGILGVTSPEAVAYNQIPRFIDLARQAADERAVSYRDFKVGASAYAISTTEPRAAYLFGANYKPDPTVDKRCAEFDVLEKARERGLDRVIALAIYGPSDFGDVNHIHTPTLHPCESCRIMLDESPMVLDDTLIITGNEKGDIELMLVQDLLAMHGTNQ